jgi:hypothetical protein
MPHKAWLIVALVCLMILGHFAVASNIGYPCYTSLLVSIGLILGILISILAHYRRWIDPMDDSEEYPEIGGLYTSSLYMGLLVIMFCLIAPDLKTAWATPPRLFLFFLAYFTSSISMGLAYPARAEDDWRSKRQQAIVDLRNVTLAFAASATGGLVLAFLASRGQIQCQLAPTILFFLLLAWLHATFKGLGWDADALMFRKCLGFFGIAYAIGCSGIFILLCYLFNVNEGTYLVASKGVLAGSLCALPIFWRSKGERASELFAIYLWGSVNAVTYLRWENTIVPEGSRAFIIASMTMVGAVLILWPRLEKRPRQRELSEVL